MLVKVVNIRLLDFPWIMERSVLESFPKFFNNFYFNKLNVWRGNTFYYSNLANYFQVYKFFNYFFLNMR